MAGGIAVGATAFLLGVTMSVQQEMAGAVSVLERLALRVAIERAVGVIKPSLRIVVDPMMVSSGEAPGGRTTNRRDDQRNDALIAEVGGRVLPAEAVLDCTVKPCRLRDADVFVSLSAPVIEGTKGTLSVTTLPLARRGEW